MSVEQYVVFGGDYYYPVGGWRDKLGSYGTLAEAFAACAGGEEWYQVADLETGVLLCYRSDGPSKGWQEAEPAEPSRPISNSTHS